LQSSNILYITWKDGRQIMRQYSRNDIRSIYKRMRRLFVNIG
jgi:hypothetical protein